MVSIYSTCKFQGSQLVYVAQQTGLILTWAETPKTSFSRHGPFIVNNSFFTLSFTDIYQEDSVPVGKSSRGDGIN